MKKLSKVIPKYAYIPFGMMLATIAISFYATRPFTAGGFHYNVSIPLDDKIPFVPAFISVYILAYVQWVATTVLAAREDMDFYFKAASVVVVGNLLAIPFFLFLPTAMVRPEVQGNGIFEWLTRLIYACDTPDNLFPSLHCLDSWVCMRVVCRTKKTPTWYKWANGGFSFLVFAAVVLVKQHLFLDIFGGILVAEAAFLVAKWLKAERMMYRLVPKRWQS
ncbi:MAG: phosphatase PAP2 family protein [Faecousia sp.]